MSGAAASLADAARLSLGLRLPIRLDNAFVGGVSFLSFAPGRFNDADLPVARRITERIALCYARERGTALLKRADEASAAASKLEARVRALTDELDARTGHRRVLGESPAWLQVLKQATQVASTGWLTLATMGLYTRPWMHIDYPDVPDSVGRFESSAFDPLRWKPEYSSEPLEAGKPSDCKEWRAAGEGRTRKCRPGSSDSGRRALGSLQL